jgi:hypothetical protein
MKFKNEINVSDLIIVLIAVIAVAIAVWQVIISKDTFSSTIRPFIGVDNIESQIDSINNNFVVIVSFKNFGSIPAKDLETIMDVYIDNELIKKDIPFQQNKQILFPDKNSFLLYALQPYYKRILNGADLKVFIDIRYYGVSDEEYTTSHRFQYYKPSNNLAPIGGEWF